MLLSAWPALGRRSMSGAPVFVCCAGCRLHCLRVLRVACNAMPAGVVAHLQQQLPLLRVHQ